MHEEKDLKAIQDKLYNFEMDLPANDWEKLAVHIPTAKKARLFPLWAQRAAAVAVIALLAGGGLYWWHSDTSDAKLADTLLADSAEIVLEPAMEDVMTENVSDAKVECVVAEERIDLKSQFLASIPHPKLGVVGTSQKVRNEEALEDVGLAMNETSVEVVDKANLPMVEDIASHSDVSEEEVSNPILTIEEAQRLMEAQYQAQMAAASAEGKSNLKAKVRNNGWSFGLLAGMTPENMGMTQAATQPLKGSNGGFQKVMKMQANTKVQNDFPVTVGLQVGYNIVDHLDVRTGLSYSYLFSTFTTSMIGETSQRLDKQALHYLGIPVVFSYRFVNTRVVNLYASVGGMFEKGLVRENKSQLKMSDGTLVSEDITRESIPGVQWSLNGNVGIGIRLYKGLQLYVEPGVSWYIPNSSHPQPISQRTSTPLNFSLQAGLRYNIN